MTEINRTMYIPLYGKAYVSRKGIILRDTRAEEIWSAEGDDIRIKGKSKSKWLAYYMGMRAAVCDNWLRQQMNADDTAVILHIGCGLDSRVHRVGTMGHQWFDVDFPDVIAERRRWYSETEEYHLTESDARDEEWLGSLPDGGNAVVVMEGMSMYVRPEELSTLLASLTARFDRVSLLVDCYTTFAAKASKYKNPVNDVGVTQVYGIGDPALLTHGTGLEYVREHEMTPQHMINELRGMEKAIFSKLFAGNFAKKMYRMYEYRSR